MRHSKCRALNRAPGSNPGLSARTNPFAYMIHIKQRDFYILCSIIHRKYLWLDMIDFKSIYAFYIDYRTVVSYNDAVKICFSKGESVMERGNTKQEILDASLSLFSVQGFEATSISQITDAVGIRKASLYSHFENKRAILEALIDEVLEQYEKHSVFSKKNREKGIENIPLTSDAAVKTIQNQLAYIIHDPYISKARKMLVIEQFQNPELAKLQTKQNYSDVLDYFTEMIEHLIHHGVITGEEPELMAAQLCLPITVWINLCDREPDRESEIMDMVEKHVRQFFKVYQVKGCEKNEKIVLVSKGQLEAETLSVGDIVYLDEDGNLEQAYDDKE